jgi:hypothetical protein
MADPGTGSGAPAAADPTAAAHVYSYTDVGAQLGAPVEVRASKLGGKGCFASRPIQAGAALWSESPLVSLRGATVAAGGGRRHEGAEGAAEMISTCGGCSCWLGTRAEMLEQVIGWARQRMAARRPRVRPTNGGRGSAVTVAASPAASLACVQACGARYCSDRCRHAAWRSHHRLLCSGCGEGGAPETLSKGAALHRGALLCYEQHAAKCGCKRGRVCQLVEHFLASVERPRHALTATPVHPPHCRAPRLHEC